MIDRIALFFIRKWKYKWKKYPVILYTDHHLTSNCCVLFFFSSFLSHFSIITMKLHKLCWCIYSHVREYERMCLCASVCVYPYKFNPLLCHFLFLLLLLLFVLNILLNYIFDAFLILYTVFAVLISLRDYFFLFLLLSIAREHLISGSDWFKCEK